MESLRQRGEMKELLMMGLYSATQLQGLVEPGPARELVGDIVRTFDAVLSLVSATTPSSPTDSADFSQIPATGSPGDPGSVNSGESGKRPAVKTRRGGYKRRKTSDIQIQVSTTMADGYAWRKYGQKVIQNTKYPRCYYRCTHKCEQGCLATKQVQVIAEEPQKYQTTYFGHHTCTNVTTKPSDFILDSNPVDPCLISFESKNVSPSIEQSYDPTSIEKLTPPVNAEIKVETVSNPTDNLEVVFWPDDLLAYDGAVISELHSSGGSTSSYGDLGMEFLMECVDFENAFHADEA